MPKALFISTSIPPLAESQTIRNVYLLRGLARAGFDIDIVAPAASGDASLLELLPAQTKIFRTDPARYDQALDVLSRVPGSAGRVLRSGMAVVAGRLIAPDVRADWSHKALAASHAIGGAVPDIIISSAGSFTAHIAAARLAEEWNRPWLADYGDPWSFNPIPPASSALISRQNLRLETSALHACSAISVTTDETASLYRDWVGASTPVHVVPCGFTPIPRRSARAIHDGTFSMAYVGSASRGTRDLRAFLRAFAEVARTSGRKMRLEIVGAHSPSFAAEARRLRLDEVRFSGWVTYAESLERMHAADALLLVGNAVALQVPAKVFNYAATSAPIFYLRQVPAATDPTLRLMRDWPGVIDVDARSADIAPALARLIDDLPALTQAASVRRSLPSLERYEWDAIGDEFAAIARSLLRAPVQKAG